VGSARRSKTLVSASRSLSCFTGSAGLISTRFTLADMAPTSVRGSFLNQSQPHPCSASRTIFTVSATKLSVVSGKVTRKVLGDEPANQVLQKISVQTATNAKRYSKTIYKIFAHISLLIQRP
jgi:hypothetical protein